MSVQEKEKTQKKKPEGDDWTVFLNYLTLVSFWDASQGFT